MSLTTKHVNVMLVPITTFVLTLTIIIIIIKMCIRVAVT